MAQKGDITIRVVSPAHGTKRVEAKQSLQVEEFLQKVKSTFDLPRNGWRVYTSRDNTDELKPGGRRRKLEDYKIKHGDMVFLQLDPSCTGSSTQSVDSSSSSSASSSRITSSMVVSDDSGVGGGSSIVSGVIKQAPDDLSKAQKVDVVRSSTAEDSVDQFLWKQDGKIARERNEMLCRHGPGGKCFHCIPYEPYDEEYLAKVNPPIKFLSFHSYLRKITGGVDKGKFAMLENISCKIKPGCKEHPPWPGGICTKCQPNAVTLMRQKYRHVDYVQFENPQLVERFLDYWRQTGNQRLGFLYGRYEHHKDVPLGIKAVVSAIYEPHQTSTKASLELLEEEDAVLNQIAGRLHLQKVGWIFTDLVPMSSSNGAVKQCRGDVNSHFLSTEECIMAAELQNKHPNSCRLASTEGHFGSKFVTVIATGNADNRIHFEGYQVSNQCMALVRDDCVVPTKDAPELGYIKESTNEQYVPDVFYKEMDTYGNEVTQLARPLPVEYLLVDLPAAFPVEPAFTFSASPDVTPFPVEHRESMGEVQDVNSFCEYMKQFSGERYPQALNDLHLLLFIAGSDVLPLKVELPELLDAIYRKDEAAMNGWLKSEAWQTVVQIIDSHSGPQSGAATSRDRDRSGGMAAGGDTWPCPHCTYINATNTANCEMCGLPKE